MSDYRCPFPYPGGKSPVVEVCWQAFGRDAASYLELCFGTGAMLFGRPGGAGKYELVNDANGLVVNAWRAIKEAPVEAAFYCSDPPSETDLRARAAWLREQGPTLVPKLEADAEFCDPRAAGWWIWCQCVGLGPDWFAQPRPSMIKPYRRGALSPEAPPLDIWFSRIADRLAKVSLACGDWERLVTPSALGFNNTGTTPTAVFGDPPYRDEALDYGSEPDVARRMERWARENGNDPRLRVVLAGHVGDYDLPGWRVLNWGGSRGWGRGKRGDNEALWFSPHCLPFEEQRPLFSQGVG